MYTIAPKLKSKDYLKFHEGKSENVNITNVIKILFFLKVENRRFHKRAFFMAEMLDDWCFTRNRKIIARSTKIYILGILAQT